MCLRKRHEKKYIIKKIWSQKSALIKITINVDAHVNFDDAEEELKRTEEFRKVQAEIEKKNDAKVVLQKMFKVV